MKNYFYKLLFACFLTATSYSQQVNNTEFKTKTLQVYQNLDKNRVPHGILLDFGMEFTNLKAFNGTLTDSTFTTSQTMSDIYKTLLMCRVRSNVTTGFITPQEYATRWYTQRANGVMILSGNYFKYNRFADNAYPSKINYSNNQFSDKFIGSTWQNPYEERQLFAIAPSISTYKGLQLKVKLPTNLFLSNYPTTIQNIQIDFSDGLGYRIVAYDQLINVNYTQPNTYTWKYKITLTDGQTMLSHSKIVIENGLNATEITSPIGPALLSTQSTTQAIVAPPDPALAGYSKKTIVSTTQYLGYNASATIYIRYAAGGNTIRKPLIVAEGFDDGIILKPEQEAGSNNINNFLESTNSFRSNSLALENEMNTYDIIYVDWNNGVTFLQRNAYVLQEVIKWVNQNKTTTTQNVVLGQSMGGLIARYALKDMENRSLPHETRLYVSHDAPHLGANTPVSVQLSARHLRNLYVNTPIAFATGEIIIPLAYNFAEGFSDIINLFGGNTSVAPNITPLQAFSLADTPATRQMTYNWVNTLGGINNTIHDAWQQDLASKGYPSGTVAKPVRNIAIANGSECGVTQTDNGNIMSYVKDAGRDTFLSNYIGILDAVYGALLINPVITVVALLPGSSYWKIDFQSKYMTTLNQNKSIYNGYIGYKKKVFWFIPVSIAVTDLNITQPTGVLPFDIYGGGQQRTNPNQLPLSGIVSNTFGFIPTASSLDVGKWTTQINDSDYRRKFAGGQPLVAPKNSPFQNFVTGFVQNNPNASNSRHISFNTRNGNWLQTELSTTTADEITDCTYICNGSQISGFQTICTSATYSLPAPLVTNYIWTVIQSNAPVVALTGSNSPNATLTQIGTRSGSVTLNLTVFSACGSSTFTKTIWVGIPIVSLPDDCWLANPTTPNCFSICREIQQTTHNYMYVNAIGADLISNDPNSWQWERITANFYLNAYGNEAYIQPFHDGTNGLGYRVRVKNSCGWSNWFENYLDIINCDNNRVANVSHNNTLFKTYPNPANNFIKIELKDIKQKPTENSIINAELYNLMGEFKKNVLINNNVATLDVTGLQKGIYILKITVDGKIESHQVAIQ